jgi:hypothetical protein
MTIRRGLAPRGKARQTPEWLRVAEVYKSWRARYRDNSTFFSSSFFWLRHGSCIHFLRKRHTSYSRLSWRINVKKSVYLSFNSANKLFYSMYVWLSLDFRLNWRLSIAWLSFDFRLTFAWLSFEYCLTFAWLSFEYCLTFVWIGSWLSLDFRLTMAWLSFEYWLTFVWLSLDYCFTFAWFSFVLVNSH